MKRIRSTTIAILALGLLAGSAVGVAAQDDEATAGATSFTGTGRGGPVVEVETTETTLPNGFTAVDGFTYRNEWESSDERLTGDVTSVNNHVIGPASGTGGLPDMVMSLAVELTNDGGSWLGEGTGFASSDLGVANEMYTLVGQDGYEGLTAYVIIESTGRQATLSGVIFPTAVPETPEPYAGE